MIPAAETRRSVRGEGTNQRFVTDILPSDQPADSLLVVQATTPASHSSSYPPHKHDQDNMPVESSLEETYYHRLNPPQGTSSSAFTRTTAASTRRWRRRITTW